MIESSVISISPEALCFNGNSDICILLTVIKNPSWLSSILKIAGSKFCIMYILRISIKTIGKIWIALTTVSRLTCALQLASFSCCNVLSTHVTQPTISISSQHGARQPHSGEKYQSGIVYNDKKSSSSVLCGRISNVLIRFVGLQIFRCKSVWRRRLAKG